LKRILKGFFIVMFLYFGIVPRGQAQMTSPGSPQSIIPKLSTDKNSLPPTQAESMTFESGIDPREYHLGPGDVFQCRFWASGEAFYPVVSSDYMLLIPFLGAFDARGKTFEQLRDSVMRNANESFSAKAGAGKLPVSLTLYEPRKVFVKVKGDVLSPGTYALSAATRPDIAIDLANKAPQEGQVLGDPETQKQKLKYENRKRQLQSIFGERGSAQASARNITVTHGDGTTDRIDIVRYDAIRDSKAAPPLREGDVIDVPLRDANGPSLGVYGAVQSPGDFEFVQGDSLMSAIQYAFGPSANADLRHVELTRISENGEAEAPVIYDLSAIQAHNAPDVRLVPNDRIIVRAKPEERRGAVVAVRGEVAEPGVFPIADGKTMLSEVIHDAGGLTALAYPAAGYILRHGRDESLTAGSPDDVTTMERLANLSVADTGNFRMQMALRPPTVVVDMDRLFVQGDRSADVKLDDGDEIVVRKRPTTVYVGGFVNNAGYVGYEDGAPLNYYIARAGGYADGAVKSETVVVKLRSKAWMDPGDTKIEPGDEIFVPKRPDNPIGYEVQTISTIAGLVTGLGALIVSLYLAFIKK
jgi:protein involved in polysaccharide export with SLBB domain